MRRYAQNQSLILFCAMRLVKPLAILRRTFYNKKKINSMILRLLPIAAGGNFNRKAVFDLQKQIKHFFCTLLSVLVLITSCACSSPKTVSSGSAEENSAKSNIAESAGASDGSEGSSDAAAEANDSKGFVLVSDLIPDVIQEIRYYTTYNFVGKRIDGYKEPCALLTREAADALKEASDEFRSMGYRLKIYDAYRPQMAVDHFVRWANNPDATEMKPFFYPDVEKEALFICGYVDSKSGHSRGSSIDLTLFDMASGKEVDMGGTFDYFGELSRPTYSNGLTERPDCSPQNAARSDGAPRISTDPNGMVAL